MPGITAALACAAETGIPLTHRDTARMVTLATGHTRDGRLDLDFAALACGGQTIAVYMGLTTLPALRGGLVAAGLDASTPAAIVENGGSGRARTMTGTLASIAQDAKGWASGSPVLVLVGDVVRHRPIALDAACFTSSLGGARKVRSASRLRENALDGSLRCC